MSDDTYRGEAERYADQVLDEFSEAADTLEGVRLLIARAWLEGSVKGSEETAAIFRAELERLAPEPRSIRVTENFSWGSAARRRGEA